MAKVSEREGCMMVDGGKEEIEWRTASKFTARFIIRLFYLKGLPP